MRAALIISAEQIKIDKKHPEKKMIKAETVFLNEMDPSISSCSSQSLVGK